MNKQIEKKNNYYVDFWKFIFSIVIVSYHTHVFAEKFNVRPYFCLGFLAVDFYFVVTGYLMVNSIIEHNKKYNVKTIGRDTIKFIFSKFKTIFPYLILSMIVSYIIIHINDISNIQIMFSNNTLAEVFNFGFLGYGTSINGPAWYVSVMMAVLFITYPLYLKFKENYSFLVAPIIICLTIIVKNFYNISMYDSQAITYLFTNGFYRGLIFINLGIIAYEISKLLREKPLSKTKRAILTVIESALYIVSLADMYYGFMGYFGVAILMLFAVIITFSNQSYTAELFTSKKWRKVSKFGFVMYLNHVCFRSYCMEHFLYLGYRKMFLIFWALTLALSIVTYILVEGIIYIYIYQKRKIRKTAN